MNSNTLSQFDDDETICREMLLKTLPYVLIPTTFMYLALSAGHYWALAPTERAIMLPLSSVTALLLFIGTACYRGNLITTDSLYPVSAGIVFLVTLNSLTHLHITEQDYQSTNIAMILMASGTFLLSSRWWLVTISSVFIAWLIVALSISNTFNWFHYGFMIFLSLILSYAAFESRRRSIIRQIAAMKEAQKKSDIAEAFADQLSKLERVLPLCAWCKKIQLEDQSWESLEYFISRKSDTGFTHGICDSCEKTLKE